VFGRGRSTKQSHGGSIKPRVHGNLTALHQQTQRGSAVSTAGTVTVATYLASWFESAELRSNRPHLVDRLSDR